MIAICLFGYVYFAADPVFAAGLSAEYKCTTDCSFCVTFDGKKTVCSEKYADDSEEYEKGKKLSRFVNEGLIIPSSDIKQGFSLNAFANKFFNCEFMIKKAEQIKQAAENMCIRKTVKRETYVNRVPASTKADDDRDNGRADTGRSSDSRKVVRDKEKPKSASLRDIKKAHRNKHDEGDGKELAPPPTGDSMDDLIKQMDD